MLRRPLILALLALVLACPALAGTVRVRLAAELVAALGAAKPGTTVEVAAGRYLAPPGGFRVPSNVRVIGDWPGRNRITGGTIVIPASANDHGFVLCAGEPDPAGNVRLENLIVKGPGTPGAGCGFVLDVSASGTPSHVEFVRCMAWGVGQDGFYLRHATRSLNSLILEDISTCRNGRHGLYLERGAWARISGAYFNSNAAAGAWLNRSDFSQLIDCYAEGNQKGPQIVLEQTLAGRVERGVVEGFGDGVAIELRGGRECRVDGVSFLSGSPAAAPTGSGVVGVGTESPWIGRCLFRGVKTMTASCGSGNMEAQDVARY